MVEAASSPDRSFIATVVADVLASRRYRWLAPELVARIAVAESPKAARLAEAVKRTKRRLHQVCGAYVETLQSEVLLDRLRDAAAAGEEQLRDACREAMTRHASTRERLPVLDRFFAELFAVTGRPRVVLDLACGLNPLAAPWMDLPPDAVYLACDVDRRLVTLVDGFLALRGIRHAVELRDVATLTLEPAAEALSALGADTGLEAARHLEARFPDAERAGRTGGTPAQQRWPGAGAEPDVALLLKTGPCLEQQAPGASRALLASLQARHVVVSFPTRSLGGAGKGMVAHYRQMLRNAIAEGEWRVTELSFPLETVYVLSRPGNGPGDDASAEKAISQPGARLVLEDVFTPSQPDSAGVKGDTSCKFQGPRSHSPPHGEGAVRNWPSESPPSASSEYLRLQGPPPANDPVAHTRRRVPGRAGGLRSGRRGEGRRHRHPRCAGSWGP
jgi:16S rRNA (guanine(1405)-N(7))-methyltransferase